MTSSLIEPNLMSKVKKVTDEILHWLLNEHYMLQDIIFSALDAGLDHISALDAGLVRISTVAGPTHYTLTSSLIAFQLLRVLKKMRFFVCSLHNKYGIKIIS